MSTRFTVKQEETITDIFFTPNIVVNANNDKFVVAVTDRNETHFSGFILASNTSFYHVGQHYSFAFNKDGFRQFRGSIILEAGM